MQNEFNRQQSPYGVTCLILGIISIPLAIFLNIFSIPLPILSIIFGYLARKQNDNLGLAGIILGIIAIVIIIVFWMFVIMSYLFVSHMISSY